MSHSPLTASERSESYEQGWEQILKLINTGGSWSGHERNCCFLNTGRAPFADVSAVAGLDFLDDGRCAAPVDWDLDGDLDLWMVSRTGPRVRFVRNDSIHDQAPSDRQHFIALRLEGVTCNKDAIGARVELKSGDRTLVRTLAAGDGYLSQGSKWIHIGLGDNPNIDSLRVAWPGGDAEDFADLQADRRYLLRQGSKTPETWTPPERTVALDSEPIEAVAGSAPQRMVLHDRIPVPALQYQSFSGSPQSIPAKHSGPTLINLWATWCAPCIGELNAFRDAEQSLRAAGLEIVAISVDSLGKDGPVDASHAGKRLEQMNFPFLSGYADATLIDKLDAFQQVFTSLRSQKNQIPTSFLLDEQGRLAVIYPGPVEVEQLLADVEMVQAGSSETRTKAFPFAGRWFNRPHGMGELLVKVSDEFRKRGHADDALQYAGLAADLISRDGIAPATTQKLANTFFEAGMQALQDDSADAARRYFARAVLLRSDWAEAHVNLASVLMDLGKPDAAEHFEAAINLAPHLYQPFFGLGVLRYEQQQYPAATALFEAVVEREPRFAAGHYYLGLSRLKVGQRNQALADLTAAARLGSPEAQQQLQALRSGAGP